MSATVAAPLRVIAFGDPEGRIWGGVLDAGTGPAVVLGGSAYGAHAAGRTVARRADGELARRADGELELRAETETWTLTGHGFELSIAAGGSAGGEIELGTATGSLATTSGEPVALHCPAIRSAAPAETGIGSLRAVAGWFGPELSIALESLRPARASDHESDRLLATVFAPDGAVTVSESRLSTTLSDDGLPARTSLELWVGDGDELSPRRAAGEASGGEVRAAIDGVELIGVPLRCHSAGLEGAGVYLLARFS